LRSSKAVVVGPNILHRFLIFVSIGAQSFALLQSRGFLSSLWILGDSDDSSVDPSSSPGSGSRDNTTVTVTQRSPSSLVRSDSPGYPQRVGGQLVHSAVDAHDPFAWIVTHLETPGYEVTPSGLWEWAMELRGWQDHQSDATRRSRTIKKRKHMSLPPSLLSHTAKRTTASNNHPSTILASDEEEAAWMVLHRDHGGNAHQALLQYTASWGDGDAAEAVTANHGYAWREFVRSRRCLRTGVYCTTAPQQQQSQSTNLTSDWDDIVVKETWEAVLNCARLCSETKVSLSALSAFLTHATFLGEASETVVSREVNTTMNSIVHRYIQGRVDRAKLLDLWYDPNGVDVDELKILMDSVSSPSTTEGALVLIDELEEMRRQLRIVAAWQQRVNALRSTCNTNESIIRNDLSQLEALDREGSRHGFRSKGHIELKKQLESIYELQDKIEQLSRKKATVKSIAALVRDIHRIGVQFPVANSLLRYNKMIDSWLAEAGAAIRSVTPIASVRCLIERGSDLPTSLQDHMDKLMAKLNRGEAWLQKLYSTLSYHGDDFCTISHRIQKLLGDEATAKNLFELIQDSNTLPVSIGYVYLLEVEVDAHQWTVEAQEFLDTKTAMETLKTHCEAAGALRQRLQVNDEQRAAWALPLENEMKNVLASSHTWMSSVEPILGNEKCVSTIELVKLKDEGNNINADLGATMRKFDSVVEGAKTWYDQHQILLDKVKSDKVSFDALKSAELAAKDVSVRLQEVEILQALVKRVQRFHDGASVVLGDKRGTITTLDDLESLRDDALNQPVDLSVINSRLSVKLEEIKNWKESARAACESISISVLCLRDILEKKFGSADEFQRDHTDKDVKSDDSSDLAEDELDLDAPMSPESSGLEEIRILIREFHRGAKDLLVSTQETRFADLLYQFNQWIAKSLKYIQSQREIFDKRFFGAFDRFLAQGQELAKQFLGEAKCDTPAAESCNYIVSDQMKRFRRLLGDRNAFVSLCQLAKQAISGSDRQPTLEQIVKLSNESENFPDICSEINSIRRMSKDASALVLAVRPAVEKRARLPLDEACAYLQKAKTIGFVCEETRLLNNGVKAARSWARRVQLLCKEIEPDASKVKTLIGEYEGLMIDMAEDKVLLEKTQTRYCLCQQAHRGFMVCCEECEDWFHGTCIGLNEKSAKKRFVCLRCNIVKTYQLTAASTATLIRKWSSVAELKKARLADLKKLTLKESRQRQSLSTIQSDKASLASCLEKMAQSEPTPMADQSTTISSASSQQPTASKADQTTNCNGGNPPSPPAAVIPIAPTTKPFSAIAGTMVISLAPNTFVHSVVVTGATKSQVAPTPDTDYAPNAHESSMASATHASEATSTATIPNAAAQPQPTSSPIKALVTPIAPDATSLPRSNSTGSLPQPQPNNIASSSTSLSKDDIVSKIEKLLADETKWTSRIQTTVNQRNELARGFVTEDAHHAALYGWIQRFRSLVFAPETNEAATASMPARDGSLPEVMKQLITEAEKAGIHIIPDVRTIVDNMHCLAWCLRASVAFARQPSLTEVNNLLYSADCLGLIPNHNTVKTMKNLTVKVRAWEKLAKEVLNPCPAKKVRLFCEENIQNLLAQCDNLPLRSSYESRLVSVVEDGYNRHCICGGPSDGRFMISCDKCDQWYHGCCVGKSSEEMADSKSWLCPVCTKTATNMQLCRFHEMYDVEEIDEDDDLLPTPKAPDVNKMWPPIGLVQSETAQKALGLDTSVRTKHESPPSGSASSGVSATDTAAFRESHGTAVNRNAPAPVATQPPSKVTVKPPAPPTAADKSRPTSSLQNGFFSAPVPLSPLPPVYHPTVTYVAPARLSHPGATVTTIMATPGLSGDNSARIPPEAHRKPVVAGIKRQREETTTSAEASQIGTNGGLVNSCHPHKIPALSGEGTNEPRRTVDLAGNA
jgi:hypothetical protein